jgi:hypothetical protein
VQGLDTPGRKSAAAGFAAPASASRTDLAAPAGTVGCLRKGRTLRLNGEISSSCFLEYSSKYLAMKPMQLFAMLVTINGGTLSHNLANV